MAQTEKKRDFKVLAEKIAPDNVLIMAELLAIKETKTLVKFIGQHAIRAHAVLCTDVFCKDMPDYTLSDNYDIVQSVAAFLCEHYGEYLDDFLYISKRGKNISIKVESYLIVTRMLCEKYRFRQRYISLERIIKKLEYDTETAEEEAEDAENQAANAQRQRLGFQLAVHGGGGVTHLVLMVGNDGLFLSPEIFQAQQYQCR